MPEPVIKCTNISKKFCRDLKRSLWYGAKDIAGELTFTRGSDRDKLREKEFWGVRNVSFELAKGETLGLVGHNGSGKSTLLKLLNGIYYPDVGQINLRGRVGALIELGAGFNPTLTGRENIYINASVLGMRKKDVDLKFKEILDFADIGDFIDSPVRNYSSGMKVRLGFSVATHLEPDILLIDEILAVGDSSFRERCYQRLITHKENGGSVIFVSHNSLSVEAISDRVIVLNDGLIVKNGAPSETLLEYEQDMQNINTLSVSETDQSQIIDPRVMKYKSSDMEITDLEFLDNYGDEKSEFAYNESFKICVNYKSVEGTKNAYFILAIHKRSGQEAPVTSFSMPWDSTSLKLVPTSGSVICEVRNPTLTPGNYVVKGSVQSVPHAGIGSGNSKWYARPRDVGKFSIGYTGLKEKFPGVPATHAISGMPPVMMDHSWVISE